MYVFRQESDLTLYLLLYLLVSTTVAVTAWVLEPTKAIECALIDNIVIICM